MFIQAVPEVTHMITHRTRPITQFRFDAHFRDTLYKYYFQERLRNFRILRGYLEKKILTKIAS